MLAKDFTTSAAELPAAFARLRKEFSDLSKPVPLSPTYEEFFQSQTGADVAPWFASRKEMTVKPKNFAAKWFRKSFDLLRHKPGRFLKAVSSPAVWSTKLRQHRTAQFYDNHAHQPDLTKPYVYLPLQAQPEEGVSPRAGAFENQELIAQILAAHLPADVRIYIKEHPHQGELFRSEEFYRSLLQIPAVTFVPRTFDTFTLIRKSVAVATATGSAGFEGLFRGKPFIMFGRRWCQHAPGVYTIRSEKDCAHAVDCIFRKNETPDLRELRLFLKAIDECSVPSDGGPEAGRAPPEQRAKDMGVMMHRILAPLLAGTTTGTRHV